jgi:polyketide synthase-associated protein
MSDLFTGALAVISGIKDPVPILAGPKKPIDLNGVKCQLLQYYEEHRQWIAVTFAGRRVIVHEQFLSRASAADLEGFDLVLGPVSDDRILRRTLAECLWQKGYATMQAFMNEEEVQELHDLTMDLDFVRPPVEFENSYCGRGSPAKTCLIDFAGSELPQVVRNSSISNHDARFHQIYDWLSTHSQGELGYELTSRTDLMIRMAFDDAREQYESVPNNATKQELEDFAGLIKRRRLCLLHFVGPGAAKLTLRPVAGTDGATVEIDCATNTLVAFSSWRYNYSFVAPPRSMALQTWFLSPAPQMALVGDIVGDLEGLSAGIGAVL